MTLIFLAGLTGAGKSTVLPVLLGPGARSALPDRRQLTDTIIIPKALQLAGSKPGPVTDRLERFRLTALYRDEHPEGIVHALRQHLEAAQVAEGAVFDGLRGRSEVTAADRSFPGARFLMLEALPETRIERLAGRADNFDREAGRGEADDRLRARRIVEEEQRHYDQAGARRYLESLPGTRRLIIDTDSVCAAQVRAQVEQWL